MQTPSTPERTARTTLVLGGTGKTGRRVAERLAALDLPHRIGSRSAELPFEWSDPKTWAPALEGIGAVYLAYYPDLAVPGAVETVRAFIEVALSTGARRIVLLSGRGEEEAQRAEQVLMNSGADWTILRCGWFSQNFSESFLLEPIVEGTLCLPAGDVREPFVDAEDIADVAVAALTDDRHIGELYELTGPRLLSFHELVAELAKATGRELRYVPVSHEDYAAGLAEAGLPPEFEWLVNYLFSEVLDGRNATLADGVERALGRQPRDFADFAKRTAASGIWNEPSPVA